MLKKFFSFCVKILSCSWTSWRTEWEVKLFASHIFSFSSFWQFHLPLAEGGKNFRESSARPGRISSVFIALSPIHNNCSAPADADNAHNCSALQLSVIEPCFAIIFRFSPDTMQFSACKAREKLLKNSDSWETRSRMMQVTLPRGDSAIFFDSLQLFRLNHVRHCQVLACSASSARCMMNLCMANAEMLAENKTRLFPSSKSGI